MQQAVANGDSYVMLHHLNKQGHMYFVYFVVLRDTSSILVGQALEQGLPVRHPTGTTKLTLYSGWPT